jgi:hypothetical protein
MTAFFEKKEADLSGKKNSSRSGGARKSPSTDRKGKGKEKVNGEHADAKTAENGTDNVEHENEEKEANEAK